jgi:glutathione synthase/RimK-type ligase-like ATP-grasp enzyme
MSRPVIGLLLPPPPRPPRHPSEQPIGRAALALSDRLTVLVGGQVSGGLLHGHIATPSGWAEASLRPDAVIDRFPGQSRPDTWRRLLHGLGSCPVYNPPRLVGLLFDKLRTQDVLAALGMPPVCADPRAFDDRLAAWGTAFAKPRFGSFGRGVHRVQRPPPARTAVDGRRDPTLLQRAIAPPAPWMGVAARILVQDTPEGWRARPPVVRLSESDPVVNHARGATVFAAADAFGEDVAAALQTLALRVAHTLANAFPTAIELGVDAVLDAAHRPHLIEVNARPRGRLGALAAADPDRFAPIEAQACKAPFLTALARLTSA